MTARELSMQQETSLEQRITQMLTEARVVLPGVQALLGFQLVSVLTQAFEKLPASSKLSMPPASPVSLSQSFC